MKITGKLVVIATLLVVSVSAYAEAYIRPELLGSQGKLEIIKSNKIGAGIAGGLTLGAQNEHNLSISLSQTNFTDAYSYQVVVGTARTDGNADYKVKVVPLMLNYRYVLLASNASIRPYFGPSIGLVKTTIEVSGLAVGTYTTTGAEFWRDYFSNSMSKTSFNWGATLGAVWNINGRFAVDLGYRYSETKIENKEWEMNSKMKVNTVALGARFRF